MKSQNKKIILHYDMDCFYASIEIRDNPKLKYKPVVVAGGIITTSNYEARKYGIKSAMPTKDAKKLCPHLIILDVNKEKYINEAEKIQNLVLKLTEKIEFIALDEGYIDITDIISNYSSPEHFANLFRYRIFKNTGLTCSVGIGYNKLSAKIASDINKPNGQYIFYTQQDFINYIKEKPIKILPGVGRQLYNQLLKNNIKKVEDIFKFTNKELEKKYGKSRGNLLYMYSRGIDYREVEFDKKISSIGNENTFILPLTSEIEITRELQILFIKTFERLIKNNLLSKTIVIKVRFNDMETLTKSKTFGISTDSKEKLFESMEQLSSSIHYDKPVRLLGVSFANLLDKSAMQLAIKF